MVGPSGAGKSTLAAVLTGAVRPDAGRVTLDGRDCPAYAERGAATGGRRAARRGVRLPRHGAGEPAARPGRRRARTELAAATAGAGLLDWVRAQPEGWDTVVGEEGGQLSGGQRQRLALARALLAAPPVLVLDEPTEGLDPAAADAVLASALAATPAGHSVLLISHRLSGLAELDEIVVLDGGRVIQRGRHAELVAAPGLVPGPVAAPGGGRARLPGRRPLTRPGTDRVFPDAAVGVRWQGDAMRAHEDGVVDSTLHELSTRLHGPARLKADLLTEARHELVDAVEAYRRTGCRRRRRSGGRWPSSARRAARAGFAGRAGGRCAARAVAAHARGGGGARRRR